MNLYEQRSKLNLFLLGGAALIILASLVYTNFLVSSLAEQGSVKAELVARAIKERSKVALWANAYRNLNMADENADIGFLFEVIKTNESVPVILTDAEGNVKAWRNLDSAKVQNNPEYLQKELERMKANKAPLEIEVGAAEKNYIYYEDSFPLRQLKYFPFIQLAVIAFFVIVGYLTLSTTRAAEQNRIWVGMAKETAHQLGTPISSLMAWTEYLKDPDATVNQDVLAEVEKDVNRLELIAERFSKIGSKPVLEPHNINEIVSRSVDYIRRRSSDKATFKLEENGQVTTLVNPPLFEWVMENLLKNALDAMEGSGTLTIFVKSENDKAVIEVSDTGKGIPKSKFNTVFQPGYSTKKRGWGLGLTLTKRIIETYHSGKIYVKESIPNQKTTFVIIL